MLESNRPGFQPVGEKPSGKQNNSLKPFTDLLKAAGSQGVTVKELIGKLTPILGYEPSDKTIYANKDTLDKAGLVVFEKGQGRIIWKEYAEMDPEKAAFHAFVNDDKENLGEEELLTQVRSKPVSDDEAYRMFQDDRIPLRMGEVVQHAKASIRLPSQRYILRKKLDRNQQERQTET